MRLLRNGTNGFLACSFCLGGAVIRGVCRFRCTSAVNLASHRAASWGVGVGSLGGVLVHAITGATLGMPFVAGVACGCPRCSFGPRAGSVVMSDSGGGVGAARLDGEVRGVAANSYSVSMTLVASLDGIEGVAAGAGEVGSTAHAVA